MNRHTRPTLGFAGALLFGALAVAACGRGGTAPGAAGTPPPDAVATAQASPTPEPSDAASPAPTFDPGTAIDAVDSDLQALDQFLNGLDSSIAGSDGQAGGGE